MAAAGETSESGSVFNEPRPVLTRSSRDGYRLPRRIPRTGAAANRMGGNRNSIQTPERPRSWRRFVVVARSS